MEFRRKYYVSDDQLLHECDRLPGAKLRAIKVQSLIQSYGLLLRFNLVRLVPASYNEMRQFHSESYLDHVKRIGTVPDNYVPTVEDELYGLAYDCPPVSNLYNLISMLAGATIAAATSLVEDNSDIAINWCGGWHHAQRSAARGYCYVNDVVLGIIKLQERFHKVLYIDMDIHHADAVQEAFYSSNTVFTLSFHKYEPGFYPGTGDIDEIGSLAGIGYNCNFPLKDGYSDDTMIYAFDKVFNKVYNKFRPDAIVMQCGADALSGDPNGGAALTCHSYFRAVEMLFHKKIPVMLLGGGGYKAENAARLWTSILALSMNVRLYHMIPDHLFWPIYGPGYSLVVFPSCVRDLNTREYIDMCINTIENNLQMMDQWNGPQAHCSHDQPDQNRDLKRPAVVYRIFKHKQAKLDNEPEQPKPKRDDDVFDFDE